MKRPDGFALLAALLVLAACAWPDLKVGFGLIGSSPGSTSSGLNLYLSELSSLLLGAWTLLSRERRRVIGSRAWALAALLAALAIIPALTGLARGWHPRDVAAEARFAALVPGFLAVAALGAAERRLVLRGLWSGMALYALQQALLLALEPSGAVNLNVLPLPAASTSHDLAQQIQLGFMVLALGGLSARGRKALALAAGLWALIFLSYLRALWVCLPLAALAGAAWSWRAGGGTQGRRYLGFQALAALLGLLLCMAGLWSLDPDGFFLMRFRLQRTAQAIHLAPATPLHPWVPAPCSAVLKTLVLRDGLYYPLESKDRSQPFTADPSAFDRGLMRQQALGAFRKAPWLGAGYGALFEYRVNADVARIQRDPHNAYAWLAAKSGLVGLGLAGALLLLSLGALWGSGVPAAVPAALLLVLLLDLFQCSWLVPAVLFPFSVLLASALPRRGGA